MFKLAKKFRWLLSFHILHHLYLVALPPLFPLLRETIVPSYTLLGVLRGVFTASGFLMILSGRLADTIGEEKTIILEFFLLPACLLLSALSPSYGILLIFIALLGISKTLYHPAGLSFLSKAVPDERRGKVIGLHESMNNIGAGLAFIIIGPLGAWVGWRMTLALLGIPALLVAIWSLLSGGEMGEGVNLTSKGPDQQEESAPSGMAEILGIKDKKLIPFYLQVASSIIGGIGFGAFVTFLASFLTEAYDLSTALAGLLVGMSYLLGFFGNIYGGGISDKIGEVLSYTIFTGAAAIPIVAIAAWRLPLVLLIPSLGVCFLLRALGNPADKALLAEHSGTSQRGRGFGSLFTSYTFGSFVSGPLFGFLIDTLGLRPSFLIIPFLFVAGAAVRYQVKRY